MAQNSWHWGGIAVGDAGEYDNDTDWSDIWRKLLTLDRTIEGVVAGHAGVLEVTNPAGQTVRVAPGMAIVDGKFYESDANEDTLLVAPGAGTDYYLMVLRKAFAAQTVRQTLLGPVNGGPAPGPTQVDGTTWDLPLAEVRITAGGVVTIIANRRRFAQTMLAGQVLIEEEILATATNVITFANIPQIFRHLRLVIQTRGTAVATGVIIYLTFNNDVAANYDYLYSKEEHANTLTTGEALGTNFIRLPEVAAANAPAGTADAIIVDVPNYRGTTFHKTVIGIGQWKANNVTANIFVNQFAGWWRNAAAITEIDLTTGAGNFAIGSIFSLYGVL